MCRCIRLWVSKMQWFISKSVFRVVNPSKSCHLSFRPLSYYQEYVKNGQEHSDQPNSIWQNVTSDMKVISSPQTHSSPRLYVFSILISAFLLFLDFSTKTSNDSSIFGWSWEHKLILHAHFGIFLILKREDNVQPDKIGTHVARYSQPPSIIRRGKITMMIMWYCKPVITTEFEIWSIIMVMKWDSS